MLNILFSASDDDWHDYRDALPRALTAAGITATVHCETDQPGEIDYIVYAPSGGMQDFTPFARAKAVLSLWAGVERIVQNATLTQPLCRMVDTGLEEGMVEWVTAHVLRHHIGMDAHIQGLNGRWDQYVPPLARNRTVAVLGQGALGAACAQALSALRFNVLGWGRTPKTIAGVTGLHGDDGLAQALSQAEIVVLLLPDTPSTNSLLDAETLAKLPRGAVVINPGRGTLIDDDALLAALDSGQIGHATLDVFRTEPLPETHPFWAHPGVTVTPHIAAATRPESASQVIAQNIQRCETGQPLLYRVDRQLGY